MRKAIYTTNAVEAVHRQFCKRIKTDPVQLSIHFEGQIDDYVGV